MEALLLLLKHFAVFVFFLFLAFLTGKSIRLFLKNTIAATTFFSDVFYSLLLGLISLVFLQSLFFSAGYTVNLLFIPIGLAFLAELKAGKDKSVVLRPQATAAGKKTAAFYALFLLAGCVVCFAWEAFFMVRFQGFPLAIPFVDHIFYAKLAYGLEATGQENIFNMENLISGQVEGITLYHYFELWLTSIFSFFFGFPSLTSLILNSYPVFYFIVFVGILALAEQFTTLKAWHLVLLIALLFVSEICLDVYISLKPLQYIKSFWGTMMTGKKSAPWYIIIMANILLMSRQQYRQAFLVMLCLPVISITALVPVAGGLGLLTLLLYLLKIIRIKDMLLTWLAVAVLGLALFGFNYWAGAKINVYSPDGAIKGLLNISWADAKTKINLMIGGGFQLVLLFLPYLLVIAFEYKSLRHSFRLSSLAILAACFSMSLAGLVGWVLLSKVEDMMQLFNLTAFSYTSCTIIYFIIAHTRLLQARFNSLSLAAAMLLLSASLIFSIYYSIDRQVYNFGHNQIYSGDYLVQINQVLNEQEGPCLGASMIDPKTYLTEIQRRNPNMMRLGHYLGLMKKGCFTYSINDFSIPDIPGLHKRFFQYLPFSIFVTQQQQHKQFVSIEQSQLDFIKKHRLRFLIASRYAALSPQLSSHVQKQIVDPYSGEKFILFK